MEDHGYVLDIGLPSVSGFLRYNSQDGAQEERRPVGSLVNVVVDKLAEDARTCIFTDNESDFKTAVVSPFVAFYLRWYRFVAIFVSFTCSLLREREIKSINDFI